MYVLKLMSKAVAIFTGTWENGAFLTLSHVVGKKHSDPKSLKGGKEIG